MTPALKRGAVASAALHLALLLAFVLVLPAPVPPVLPPEQTVEMEFQPGTTAQKVQRGEKPADKPAPADAPTPADQPPAKEPPKPAPVEPPLPTPPLPVPPPPAVVVPPAPAPTPPPLPREQEDLPLPPRPPPPAPPEARRVPPAPPVPPAPVVPQRLPPVAAKPTPPAPAKPTPEPPLPSVARPPPSPRTSRTESQTSQPNETRNAAPDTSSLLNTLEKFRANQQQTRAPTAKANPSRGGAPAAGGAKSGDITGQLTQGQQRQIGDEVRNCYSEDTAAKDYAKYSTHMVVTVDAAGTARGAEFSPEDAGRMGTDPAFRAFAERARRAVLDSHCASLPVPRDLLGQVAQLKFVFRP